MTKVGRTNGVVTGWVAFSAGIVGVMVSVGILTLHAMGVSGVLFVNQVDFIYVLWPFSLMLTVGWQTTPLGITITLLSIVANGLLYAVLAAVLWKAARQLATLNR
jgi:hypothetical protein